MATIMISSIVENAVQRVIFKGNILLLYLCYYAWINLNVDEHLC